VNSPRNSKGMLVVLAVSCAGAGSYWLFGRGEDGTNTEVADSFVERRQPLAPDTVKPKPTRPTVADSEDNRAVEPRTRPDPPDSNINRRPKPGADKPKDKKPIRNAA